MKQVTKLERRQKRLRKARQAADSPLRRHGHLVAFSETDKTRIGVEVHHHISPSRNHRQHIRGFVHENAADPAKKGFIPKLKNHLLGRLLGRDFDGDEEKFTEDDRATVKILGHHIYSAKLLRVNYTTYDMRRDQDCINPRTHSDVMVMSPETGPNAHPFWYARGAHSSNNGAQRMEFLWVRWFGIEPDYRFGFKAARLPKVGFVPEDDLSAFGFLDPALVLRGCHLIPAFAAGRTNELLKTVSPTTARPLGETDDWVNFYVTIWVDRDMFMRYLGGGIGHICQASALPAEELDIGGEEPEGAGPGAEEPASAAATVPQREEPRVPEEEEPRLGDGERDESSDSDSEPEYDSGFDSSDSDSDNDGDGSDGAYDDEDREDDDPGFAAL
ncbi:hypothetical protein C8F04DRAFT_1221791 [Mycena alexandri]|uniref:Uncharacterized protein n=1 Tax=Mycena alexandri TaxID=1745969 RepID=A0AAD6SRW8_9AGAR|nr:hypothetical protein C8F04DRAFT_1221791 [Mycena alexandri]